MKKETVEEVLFTNFCSYIDVIEKLINLHSKDIPKLFFEIGMVSRQHITSIITLRKENKEFNKRCGAYIKEYNEIINERKTKDKPEFVG